MTTETMELLTRRAPLGNSFNAETLEFEVTFATSGGAVLRYDERGPYTELLDVAGLEAKDNIPFLDNHARDLDSVLGAVKSTWINGREAKAQIRLSRSHPRALRLAADLSDDFSFGVSCGYQVKAWKETNDPKTGARIKTATKWVLREISLATIPADDQARTRGSAMEIENPPAAAPVTPAAAAATPETIRTAPADTTTVQTRAEINKAIRSIADNLKLPQTWVDTQIDAEATAEQARAAATTAMMTRNQPAIHGGSNIQIGADYTDPEFRARTLGEGLYSRINPSHNPTEPARQYRGMSMVDLAVDCLRLRSMPITGLSPAKLVERALHTTSDFPLILGDAANRTLLDGYRVNESALKQAARQVNARDFRVRQRLLLSEGPELDKLGESGEIRAGTLKESKQSYKLDTYAKRLGISRQIIVNDDLGAFSDIPRRLGQGAAAKEAKLLAAVVEDNGDMSDGVAMFHADHGNLAATGNSPWITSAPGFLTVVSDARLAMRRQTSLQGNPITVGAKYLIVPPEGETEAEKLLSDIAAAKIADANPMSNKLTLIVEGYFENGRGWYLAADPATADGLEWSYLEGEEGPQIETRAGWEIEGMEVKVRLDFGAGFVDTKGWYKNAGTAP
jgi:hypothetical protein